MHPAPRTDWYRRKQEQDREELNQLESEYQKRIKNLEEMEDNRKTRVADKVRQQQTSGGSASTRVRGATLGASGATGQTWSSVVKSGAPASTSASTASTAASSSRAEGSQLLVRDSKAEAKTGTAHKRQTSGGSSPVRGRGASPSRSSIQAGTVRKMQGSFTSSTSSGNVSTSSAVKGAPPAAAKTSETRTRLNTRSITTAAPKAVSLAPYAASAAPYSPSASSTSTSTSRTRIARSPSISPTISAIASTFSGPNTAPQTTTAASRTPAIPRGATTSALATSGQTTSPSITPPPKAPTTTTSTSPKRTAATTTYSAAASKAKTPTITVTSTSSKTVVASAATTTTRAPAAQVRARSSPSIASKTVVSSSARTTTATTATSAKKNSTSSTTTATSSTTQTSAKKGTIAAPTPVRGRSTSPSRTPNSVSKTPPTATASPPSASSTPIPAKAGADALVGSASSTSVTRGSSEPASQISTPISSLPRLSSVPEPVALEAALIRGTRLEMRGKHLIHGQGEQVCIWDISEQSCTTIFSGHTTTVHTVALRPNHTVISASKEEVLVWEANTEKVLSYHPGCTALAAHPTLDQIATGHKDGSISIQQPLAAAPLKTIESPSSKISEISALAWSSNTHLLVAQGNLIYLIDTTSSKVERTFEGHQGSILHIQGFVDEIDASTPSNALHTHATHFFSLCDKEEVICFQTHTGIITSKGQARGKCATLFVFDDRHSKGLSTQHILPILVDPEGITVIVANDTEQIKMEEPGLQFKLSLFAASTPVLLI